MKFCDTFGIKKGDVICIAGAGGKTSLMMHLATELKSAGLNVLITTTTRLATNELADQFYFLVNINGEKAEAPDISEIEAEIDNYDVILIEADGSAGKPLKGWREDEPVIPEFATKTIGVVDISTVGKRPDIHRPELFEKLTGETSGISVDTLSKIINDKKGIFKNSQSTENIVYLSRCESDTDIENAEKFAKKTDKSVTFGSVKKGEINKIPRLNAVIMAAGSSSRMGENKLLMKIEGKAIISCLINTVNHADIKKTVLVHSDDEVAETADNTKIIPVKIDAGKEKDATIKSGTNECLDSEGIMYLVADQPFIKSDTLNKLADIFYKKPDKIIIPVCSGKQRNPVIFPKKVYIELMNIKGDRGGRDVINNHPELVEYVEFYDEKEFADIDTRQDYEKYT